MAQIPPEPVERDLYRELLASLNAPLLAGGTALVTGSVKDGENIVVLGVQKTQARKSGR